jgi:DNA ligase-1
MKLFHPLGFMLASPVDSVAEAIRRFGQEQRLEAGGPETAGNEAADVETPAVTNKDVPGIVLSAMHLPEEQAPAGRLSGAQVSGAQVEDKYDGIRAQIHCGDPIQPRRVAIFSRSRENMTESFPEIVEAFAGFSQPAILDGEILAWVPEAAGSGGRALPFTSLQPRLGRKRITADICERAPVVFIAFDLLCLDGELLLDRPLAARREALEALVEREAPRTVVGSREVFLGRQSQLPFASPLSEDAFARLGLAPAALLQDAVQLEQAYGGARARGNEGIMLKSRRSAYQPGRRGLAWLKLKRELATLDVVVTAAEYGHGKRAGLLSDYTFAVRDGSRFRNVGKAYSGVTDAEIETLTRFFKEHTIEDLGFIRSVEPLIVLEVAFNNVMRSDRHDSGFALRFPRIMRIRDDKPVIEIDTLERVEEIYRAQDSPGPD